ncbi:hypothetical protein Pla175_39080 [Pirellulimonas nuda]|uniref:Uncharacterized protein n=1 Tax=Pirellulimonas nuda TaxID=2528009 RepID=A0A518DG90_9BACT|nr:DUF1580 domain-containing protein [Pirellulimonas nuda]QDU90503.1 hypothetical protein Pla175_39080 [Pirellulimonas nuda]
MLPVSAGDQLLPVATAIERAIGYRPHGSTCTRWTRRGVGGAKLPVAYVGGRPKTTVAAVLEFVNRLSTDADASA